MRAWRTSTPLESSAYQPCCDFPFPPAYLIAPQILAEFNATGVPSSTSPASAHTASPSPPSHGSEHVIAVSFPARMTSEYPQNFGCRVMRSCKSSSHDSIGYPNLCSTHEVAVREAGQNVRSFTIIPDICIFARTIASPGFTRSQLSSRILHISLAHLIFHLVVSSYTNVRRL